jgi:hypothetical protein
MEKFFLQWRYYIFVAIMFLTIGSGLIIYPHNTTLAPQQIIDTTSLRFRIVHCWRYDHSDTGISCKTTIDSCGDWHEGYPPPPRTCPK